MVMVNCDKREKEYATHLKEMSWIHAIPFDAEDWIIEGIEDKAHASVIPKLSIFSVEKGFDRCVVMDIKQIILKNENMSEAVSQVLAKIKEGEEAYHHIDEATARISTAEVDEDEEWILKTAETNKKKALNNIWN